ncbi:SMC family ATPase [Streptomyces sp. ODS28]|uniref:SMC family ATPase n=1 Tax=Streptomyces sp. ODS28 TaxID=3136688 RepID=UPI0031E62B66
MRLHRLSMTAFGPFGGTHEADFDELSAAGLFLLHGATGAGKTSVLDAVCYALYGGVPGARQQPGGTLRSDHAAPGTLTEVTLELTVAGRRLEVTRRPEQRRPKRRGSGFTVEKAQSWLREHEAATGDWRALSRSHQEIGEEITRLLGMSRDQFCQVVLLPQGDFARFLRASVDDRRKLLSTLFDTGRFRAVEDELAAMRRAAEDEVRAGDEELLALAQRMQQEAGPASSADVLVRSGTPGESGESEGEAGRPVPGQRGRRASARTANRADARSDTRADARTDARSEDAGAGALSPGALTPGDPGLAGAVLEWAALARARAREQRDIAALAARAAEEEHAAAAARLDDVREIARDQRRYAEAQRRAAELEERAPEQERVRERLERARSADAVAPALGLRESAQAEHAQAAEAERRCRARLLEQPESRKGGDPADPMAPADTVESVAEAPPERLTELERAARQELGALDSARRSEQRASRIGDELAVLERDSRADDEALREAEEWLSGWESAREAHTRRIDAAHEAATRAEQLGAQLDSARRRAEAAGRRDRHEEERRRADEGLLSARERAAAAYEHWLDLKDRRLRGFAAELAEGLRDGEPCKVCGSPEHPDPARPGEGHVDRAAEDAALAAHREAEAERERAEQRASAVREHLAAARAESGEESAELLAQEAARLEREHASAHAAAADAHAAREALDAAEREHARRLAQQQEAGQRVASRTSQREALLRERESLVEEVRQVRGAASSVAERAAALESRAAALAEAAEAARSARSTAQRLKDADDRLADAAYRAGFGTPQAAAEAVLGEAEQQALRRGLEQWQAERAAVAAELDDVVLAAAASRPAADVEGAERSLAAAAARLQDAASGETAAGKRCAELDRLSGRAAEDVRRLAPLRTRYERTARLAQLAAGTAAENALKMRLETYVLAARLEQVAAAASVRLARMSGGRYTLVHSDEMSGRGRSGLGLHVIDAWTGVERDTATLSGGETFSASLALALGLADVVTEESGGTRLDTLFIDEGFGSLDAETLDEVLDVLDSLRERDRCVGIVSHVADLRQRVGAQLEVLKSRRGSRLRHHAVVSG